MAENKFICYNTLGFIAKTKYNKSKEVFQMKKNSKNHHAGRIISLFIVLCMVLAIAPITAFAADSTVRNATELEAALENADCAEIKL